MKIIFSITIFLFFSLIGNTQTQIGTNIEGQADFEQMGWDVAMSGDGQTIIVGSPGSSVSAYGAGQVKILRFNGSDWVQIGTDILGLLDEDNFGRAVDISEDGNTIVVGAQYSDANGFSSGSVQVYEYDGTDWIQKGATLAGTNNDDEFGTTVSISNNGNRIAVGAPYTNNNSDLDTGVLKIFDYNGSAWNQVFEHFGDEENDVFGNSLDMSGDGNYVVCGGWINDDYTTKEGYIKVFQFDNSVWSQVGTNISGETPSIFSGASASISDDGSIVAMGSWGNDENGNNSGEVEVFEFNGTSWQALGSDIQGDNSFQRFGWAVDLSSDGTIIAIGAPQESNTRFYRYENDDWNQIGNAIDGATSLDDFGWAVDLSSDGTKVVIGDPYNDGSGSLYGFAQAYDLTNVLSVDEFSSQIFQVFPNPTSSKLVIQSKVDISAINMMDINGRVLKTFDNFDSSLDITLDVSDFSNGIYFLKIQAQNQEQVIRFLKN